MLTLVKCTPKKGKRYTKVSRRKLLELLDKYQHRKIKLRWLSQCIKDLVDIGFINRHHRYIHDPAGLITQLPSWISFTKDGVQYLVDNLVEGARNWLKSIQTWIYGNNNNHPPKEDKDKHRFRDAYPAEQARQKHTHEI